MTEYTSAIALASRLIIKKGRTITLRRLNETPAANEWDKGSVANDDHPVKGVFLGRMKIDRDGTLVRSESDTLLIAALNLTIVPVTADVILDGSTQFSILTVDELKPGDEEIMYTLGISQ